MAYGILKCDTVTFTDAGIDKSVTLSGLVQNPTFSGNVTVTGTFSGVTVTGTTANFTSGNFTNISGGTHTITSGVFAAGSAASPSITFTGDLNTGIYSPGADQVAVATNGTGRLFVDANGRVIVGAATAAIGNPLEVVSSSNGNAIGVRGRSSDNIGIVNFFPNNSSTEYARIQSNGDSSLAFGTGSSGTERLRVTSAGLVGIGTSAPNYQLHVTTDFAVGASGFNQQLTFGNDTIQSLLLGTGYTALKLNPLGGNVGIGTSSVNALLEVNNSTAGGEVQRIEGNYSGSGSVILTNWRRAGGSVAAAFKYNDDSSPLCMSIGTTTSHEFRIRTADTDAITIDASQRVGIGTSAPGQKLDVNGEIVCSPNTAGKNTFQFTTQAADDASLLMRSNTTVKVNIQANGTSYFNGGNVGIGTTGPGSTLDINGDCAVANTRAYQVKDSGGTTRYAMYMSGSLSPSAGNDLFIGNPLANPLVLYTNSTERARIA
jgi:hypothetical protein